MTTKIRAGQISSESTPDGYALHSDGAGGAVWEPESGASSDATSIQGVAVAETAPSNAQVLAYNDSTDQYEPTSISTGGSTDTNAIHVADVDAAQFVNEVMNWPSLEQANDTLPEWWEVGSNATMTEVDVAGESITETYARCLKVVSAADGSYGYQRYTYSVQPRIKSGRKLSAIFAVWSVGGKAARIRLTSSVGNLGVSADFTAAGWTILKVENITLDGTYVDIRLEVDTGTAYFVPLGICIGPKAWPLRSRGLMLQWVDGSTSVKSLNGLGDENTWTDIDITSATNALAVIANCVARISTPNASQWDLRVRRNGASTTDDFVISTTITAYAETQTNDFQILLDDQQIFEYLLDRVSGSNALTSGRIVVRSFYKWE